MIIALTIVLAAAATPSAADINAVTRKDPDPIVCERQAELGSRLRSKKICKHKSEWAEDRRNDRSNIERSQRSGINGE